ncbi:hypothetical protein LS70_001100 [Helicobacter sp. MIT 11-5569]|uniref:hypothetical protein n=1 Tax=Helicobacter sp. MIT 11-5569 TaxID=1548151 RepID=UPI00051F9F4E|nr:hypothetical protein [Helicobacter sp. MIT 11-5569]TLD85177.1 hypothetical protein LS70_001100 [Helicobacter sp. MIT 11-5569]
MDFELLLKLKELEKESGFKIEQDINNPNLFYIKEPNTKTPFASLDYSKEIENANTRTHTQTSTLRECSALFLERIRGIIGKRIARSEEIQTGSGRVREGSTAVQEGSGRLYGFNDSQIWRINPQERISLQNLNKKSQELYTNKALESYQQNLSLEENQTTIIKDEVVEVKISPKTLQQKIPQIDYEAIIKSSMGFTTTETLKSTAKDIAKDYNISQEEALKGLVQAHNKLESQEQKEPTQTKEQSQNQSLNQEQSKIISKSQLPKAIPKKTDSKKQEPPKEQGRGR